MRVCLMMILLPAWLMAQESLQFDFEGGAQGGNVPKTGQILHLKVRIHATDQVAPFRIGPYLPKGLEFLGGDTLKVLALSSGDQDSVQMTVRINQPGVYRVGWLILPANRDTVTPFETFYLSTFFVSRQDTGYFLDSSQIKTLLQDGGLYNDLNYAPNVLSVDSTHIEGPVDWIKISGTVQFESPQGNVDGAQIEVCLDRWGINITCTYTDGQGHYSFRIPGFPFFVEPYRVWVRSANSWGEVHQPWRGEYVYSLVDGWVRRRFELSPGTYTLGCRWLSLRGGDSVTVNFFFPWYSKAARLAKLVDLIRHHGEIVAGAGIPWQPVQINYPDSAVVCFDIRFTNLEWCNNLTMGSSFAIDMRAKGVFRVIVLGTYDMSPSVHYAHPAIAVINENTPVWDPVYSLEASHEIGHLVQYLLLGGKMPYGDLDREHYYRKVTNPGHAFREGFAEFWEYASWRGQKDIPEEVEFFEPQDRAPMYRGERRRNSDGRKVEGAVMQYLWDLLDDPYDDDNTPGWDDDGFAYSLQEILQAHYRMRNSLQYAGNFQVLDTAIYVGSIEVLRVTIRAKGYKVQTPQGLSTDFVRALEEELNDLALKQSELYEVVVHPYSTTDPYPLPVLDLVDVRQIDNQTFRLIWRDHVGEGLYQINLYNRSTGGSSKILLPPNQETTTVSVDPWDIMEIGLSYRLADDATPRLIRTGPYVQPYLKYVDVTPQGMALRWFDLSTAETGYRVSWICERWGGGADTLIRLLPPDTDTLFVSWDDTLWDSLPSGVTYRRILVKVESVRYGNVSPSDSTALLLPNPTLNTVTLTDSGIQISWQNKPSWAVHVAALIQMADSSRGYILGTTSSGTGTVPWNAPMWDAFPTLDDTVILYLYSRRPLGPHGNRVLTSGPPPTRETLRILDPPGHAPLWSDCSDSTRINIRLAYYPGIRKGSGFVIERTTPGGSSWTVIDTVWSSTATLVQDILSPGQAYEYRVRSFRALGPDTAPRLAFSGYNFRNVGYAEHALNGEVGLPNVERFTTNALAFAWQNQNAQAYAYFGYLMSFRNSRPRCFNGPVWVSAGVATRVDSPWVPIPPVVAERRDTVWAAQLMRNGDLYLRRYERNGNTWTGVADTSLPLTGLSGIRDLGVGVDGQGRVWAVVSTSTKVVGIVWDGSTIASHTLYTVPSSAWEISGAVGVWSRGGRILVSVPVYKVSDGRTTQVVVVEIGGGTTPVVDQRGNVKQPRYHYTDVAGLSPGIGVVYGSSTNGWHYQTVGQNPLFLPGSFRACDLEEAVGYAVVVCSPEDTTAPIQAFVIDVANNQIYRTIDLGLPGLAHAEVQAVYAGMDFRTGRSRYRLDLFTARSRPGLYGGVAIDSISLGYVWSASPSLASRREGRPSLLGGSSDTSWIGLWRVSTFHDGENTRLVVEEAGKGGFVVAVAPRIQIGAVLPNDSGLVIQAGFGGVKGSLVWGDLPVPLEGFRMDRVAYEVLGGETPSRWLVERDGTTGGEAFGQDVGDTLVYAIPVLGFEGVVDLLMMGVESDTVWAELSGCGVEKTPVEAGVWKALRIPVCPEAGETLRVRLWGEAGKAVGLRRIALFGSGQALASVGRGEGESGVMDEETRPVIRFGWDRGRLMREGVLRVGVPGGGEVVIRVWDVLGRKRFEGRVEMREGGYVERELGEVLKGGVHVVEVRWQDRVDRGRVVVP